uniref:hypothetical protein n=1 Tax=unclassified Burkholderia TaxID=2613784 RepID=UPI0032182B52
MEAIGEGASGTAVRATLPGRRISQLCGIPGPGAFTPASLASLAGAPAVADTSASDGGAAAGFGAAGFGGASDCLQLCLAVLEAAVESAPDELALAGFPEAADFAELAEKLSRWAEYLQLLGAGAVDRTRTEAINAAGPASKAAGWTTGWGHDEADDGTAAAGASGSAAAASPDSVAVPTSPFGAAASNGRVSALSPADDGC